AQYPRDKTIHQLFEEQAIKSPDSVAVVAESRSPGLTSITYRQLNEEADHLARILYEKGMESDTIVAVMGKKSITLIASLLAVLKAGGAYLPIDPDYPEERINYLLQDSNTKTLLTTSPLVNKVIFDKTILEMDQMSTTSNGSMLSSPSPLRQANQGNLAYIIYTSGTTGHPKGVMIEHRNLVRLFVNNRNPFDFNRRDVWTMFHSFCFDFSVWEMYGSLLSGGKLIVISKETAKDTSQFRMILEEQDVSVLNQTPSAFYSLIREDLSQKNRALNIRYVIFGGEALAPAKLKRWAERYPVTRLINMFGITETTVHVTFKEITFEEISRNTGNIGKPLPTLTTYIMDGYRYLAPIGISGELYVGGDGVARGYLNRPELCANKFIKNPYKPEERLYRSGDRARFLENGDMVYMERIDHQVQLRGFRIELGEIENKLVEHETVREAVVVSRSDKSGDKYLCAYFVPTTPDVFESTTFVETIRNHLSGTLPDYMIPSYFVGLEKIPLTSNGKVDRGNLPEPEFSGTAKGETYVAPGDAVEEKVTEIWSEILGIEKHTISVNGNFFQMGGHSLKATIMINKIHKAFDVKIPLGEVFKNPTIHGVSQYITKTGKEEFQSIEPVEKKEYYPVSSPQKRLYILQQMETGNIGYNMPLRLEPAEKTDPGKLTATFRQLLQRHESLRTSFHIVNDQPVQKVHDTADFDIDCLQSTEKEAEARVSQFTRPFDLSKSPLLRVCLLEIESSHRQVLLIDMHHIITDGASHGILKNDFAALYACEQLPPLRLQYKDFSEWRNRDENRESAAKQEQYWLNRFSDELPVLELPTDYSRPMLQSFEGASVSFVLPAKGTAALMNIARESGATLFMMLLALFNILLSKLSGLEDIIVGTPIAGRRHADLQEIIGMFVNTLALRNSPAGDKTFRRFLSELKESVLQAFENQEYQLEDLVERVSPQRDTGRNPLFDVMFNLLNLRGGNEAIHRPDEANSNEPPYGHGKATAKFDLTLTVLKTRETLLFNFNYSTKLFRAHTIERFIGYLKKIISGIIDTQSIRISDLDIISEDEKKRLLVDFNDTYTGYPKNKTIHQLFEEQVKKMPDRIALTGKSFLPVNRDANCCSLTYRELDRKSNHVAQLLIQKGVKADSIVAIAAERSLEMVIGIMGILKAGGAYLPIVPDIPVERIEYMLKDSEVKILLTESPALSLPNALSGSLDVIPLSRMSEESGVRTAAVGPRSLAYIIYTSGTTGRPKGVMIEHRSLVNLCFWHNRYYVVTEKDNATQYAESGFDASVWEIFPYLVKGATMFIISDEIKMDVEKICTYFRENHITISFLPTQICLLVMEELVEAPSLRILLAGGDKLERHIKCDYRLYNNYGPTENTVVTTAYFVDEQSDNIPIGKPVGNTRVYIMDKKNIQPQPMGVPGELCIAGNSLARGYLNNPELTAEKFIPAPVSILSDTSPASPISYIYRTGDMARWLSDGNIAFLGRIDLQVKIRGFRIELGEIESKLVEHETVREAVVVSRSDESGDKYLCAYFVPTTPDVFESTAFVEAIKNHISGTLPDYMLPSYFIGLEKIPLTPNGKVDRKNLPEPDFNGAAKGETYVAPGDAVEKKVTAIWSEILGIEENTISVNGNFFHMGGHSLKATIMITKIHKALDAKIPLAEVFKKPTVREIACYIKGSDREQYLSIAPAKKRQYYELFSAQKGLFFLQLYNPDSISFNMPMTYLLEGDIKKERLQSAFRKLIRRHDGLRTSFKMVKEMPMQQIHEQVAFSIDYYERDEAAAREKVKGFIKPFNLGQAPLLRVELVKVDECKYVLMTDLHHIISDGVSQNILLRDFMALYSGKGPAPLKLQYTDFSQWQKGLEESGEIEKQKQYWLSRFADGVPLLNMGTDFPRPNTRGYEGGRVELLLEKELNLELKDFIAATETTLYIVLLAVFNILLSKCSDQTDLVVGSPTTGRTHTDLDNIIGLFVNMLSLRNCPDMDDTFAGFLAQVKKNALDAFENQAFQFSELVSMLNVETNPSRHPMFDVVLAMNNTDAGIMENCFDFKIEHYENEFTAQKFDLLLDVFETGDMISFCLNYSTALFKESTAQKMIKRFVEILTQVIRNKGIKITNITISHDLLDAEPIQPNEFENSFGF
ncbi:MAG: amino acid adenylation domain-containing protein, partial [bacterium]|nr:amino acid adenylation domain-containing protein [bacterium]